MPETFVAALAIRSVVSNPKFTVDTHVFRELGELLVGRDSTALVELLKNSYDADATRVTVYGERLENPERGFIRVTDNGHGMTQRQFVDSFLRIASRAKDVARPLSPKFRRHFTGAKGIGRLAAHKLARLMEIESVCADANTGIPCEGFRATIDWDKIESGETLTDIADDAILLTSFNVRRNDKCGTTIHLKRLRRRWSERERIRFTSEASATQVPKILAEPVPKVVLRDRLLFNSPRIISDGATESNWELSLDGEFAAGDDYLIAATNAAAWVLEVSADAQSVRAALSPSRAYQSDTPDAKRVIRELNVKRSKDSPDLQARILIREGDWERGTAAAKAWRNADAHGVRVYLEGFRVLPYGEAGNDWLRIDSTYARRSRGDAGLAKGLFDDVDASEIGKDSYLSYLPVRSYLGGAFLTLDRSKSLRMLVNREGFIPNEAFYYVDDVLSAAINFSAIVRSNAKATQIEDRRKSRLASAASKFNSKQTPSSLIEESVTKSTRQLKEARQALASGDSDRAKSLILEIENDMGEKVSFIGDIRDEQAMIRILASLGTHTAGFVHELKGLLGVAQSVDQQLTKIEREDSHLSSTDRKRLNQSIMALRELRVGLERQAAYVADFSSSDARRRRSRHAFSAVFDAALEGFAQQMASRSSDVVNEIPSDLKSPPMFRAEIVAVFSNLISNALKAAGEVGRVRASGSLRESGCNIRIENTGIAVDIEGSEQWFRPFATSSTETAPDLGRGMGLGLTITRRMLEEYGAEIRFCRPRSPYATCVEIEFHG